MIILTRRTLLVGTTALTAAGMVPFRAFAAVAHLSRAARRLHGLSEPAAEELADRTEERRRHWSATICLSNVPGAGQVRAGERHAAGRRCRRRQRLADPCGDHGRARRPCRQGAARRLRLSASVRPWRAAAAGQDRQRDRRARRDLPAEGHRQVGQSRQGRAQRADGRRDRRRARRDPRQGRLHLGGLRLLPFGHGDARRRGRRERAQGRGQPISAFRRPRWQPAQAASRSIDDERPARARLQPDADRRRADHQGQAGRLLCGADHRDDAGNAAAQGHPGRRALRPVHLHHLFEARRKPQRHLSPARPGGAAAIFGRQPHAPDAAVRGRARRARVRHREDRRDHAVADRRQERRRHDRRRPAASPDARHQARHPAVGAVADLRCGSAISRCSRRRIWRAG